MTREEAAAVLEAMIFGTYPDDDITIEKIEMEAVRFAIAALRGPQPDPKTGLVPCGCGGKAEVGDGNKAFCGRCGITTLEQFTQEDAKSEWTRAMGVKGADTDACDRLRWLLTQSERVVRVDDEDRAAVDRACRLMQECDNGFDRGRG